MDAKKCDRCGSFYIHENGGGLSKNSDKVYAIYIRAVPFDLQFDLCPECYNDLLMFIKNPGKKEIDTNECSDHVQKENKRWFK